MNTYIEKALNQLTQADTAGYFEAIEQVVPVDLESTFNQLRKRFITGNVEWDFEQKLRNFAQLVDKQVSTQANTTNTTVSPDISANIDQIYNHLENGSLEEAITDFAKLINRKHKLYSNLINLKMRLKEYQEKEMKDLSTAGEREKIINDFTKVLELYEGS